MHGAAQPVTCETTACAASQILLITSFALSLLGKLHRFQRRLAADHVGGLVGDHQRRGVEIGRDHPRHDRGVDHAQALQPVHAQLVVDHGPVGVRRSHAAGAAGMERGGAALGGGGEELIVALHLRSGEILIGIIRRERLRREQPARQLHAGDDDAAVDLLDQIIGLDDRLRERVGGADADIAAALGALLP